jgi:anti-anti-sigma factor
MEIHERHCDEPGVRLLDLDGGLDQTNSHEFVQKMDALLEQGTTRVVLDLEHLAYASNWGLAALERVHHRFAAQGGRVVFARLHSATAAILAKSHLAHLFDLYQTVEEAVRKISRL